MPRVTNETAAARLARDLRTLKSRIRGLSIHDQEEADALTEALADLDAYVQIAIRVSGKAAAGA